MGTDTDAKEICMPDNSSDLQANLTCWQWQNNEEQLAVMACVCLKSGDMTTLVV